MEMNVMKQAEDPWKLDRVIHFMGGTPEDHANVAKANRKAAWARRWRAWLRR